MANFTPEGLAGEFFGLFARYSPRRRRAPRRRWAGGPRSTCASSSASASRSSALTARPTSSATRARRRDYCAFFKETFGPAIAIYGMLAGEPARVAELDQAFLDFATRANAARPAGRSQYAYEYLLVVARRAGAG